VGLEGKERRSRWREAATARKGRARWANGSGSVSDFRQRQRKEEVNSEAVGVL
jgi:hypothetical protein